MPVANYRWKAQGDMTEYRFTAQGIATFEGSRNTDPGVANVGDGVIYKVKNVDLEGTLEVKDLTFAEEATRNTDPGAAFVLREADGGPASYKHLGATKTPAYNFTAAEAARNTDMAAAKVEQSYAYLSRGESRVGTLTGGGGTPPSKPAWATTPCTVGDGRVTLHVVAASPTDTIYARWRRWLPGVAWPALPTAFSRTGTGDIVVTGLTNAEAYELDIVALVGGLPSESARPVVAIPTDGSRAEIDLIMEAVAAEVNALALQSKDTDGTAVDLAATVELPPLFDAVDTPCVKVFPDTEEGEPLRGSRNEITYRVNVAFCQRSKTAAQKQEQYRIRQTLRDHFLGRRLQALTAASCIGEAESGVLDMEHLWENFQWVSVITLEFNAPRAKG